jgi:hypothetical protein
MTVKIDEYHWLVKIDNIWQALCIKYMKLRVKYLLADFYIQGVVLDLDKYIFPW